MSGAPSRVILIAQLAPAAPPCFEARDIWLQYLGSAAEHWRDGHRSQGPLAYENGVAVFNSRFNFCHDCTRAHWHEMERAGRCVPDHLKKLAARAGAAPTPALDGQEA